MTNTNKQDKTIKCYKVKLKYNQLTHYFHSLVNAKEYKSHVNDIATITPVYDWIDIELMDIKQIDGVTA